MSSLNMFLAPAAAVSSTSTSNTTTKITTTRPRRVQTFATAAKGSGGSSEKGFFDWLVGALEKDQLVETDPVLQKVEGKSGTTTVGRKTSAAPPPPPPKKSNGGIGGFGGLGGLFAKK